MPSVTKIVTTIAISSFVLAFNDSSFGAPSPEQTSPDVVSGNLIQFNDNGNWTWYCDERSVIDAEAGNLIVGSDACNAGVGGTPRSGDVEAVIYRIATGFWQRFTLKDGASNPSVFYPDDHNAPGLLVRPDGKYLAWYAGHNRERFSYWRNFDGTNWTPEKTFDWNTIPGGTDFGATYSNPHYLSAEKRTYNFVRANDHGSPNILLSSDNGDTWKFAGQLMAPLTNLAIGYVSGYFKYCDNGVDRIDFIGTETHPRDYNTSMYHGYIKGGQSFRSDGMVVDTNIFDQSAPFITQFTPIFTNGTVRPPGQTNYRCWNDDVQMYPDGTIQAIISTRLNNDTRGNDSNNNPAHAFFFCRYDGTKWTSTYLCQAGEKLYMSEADYVGVGSLDPDNPNVIYISTTYDPRSVKPGVHDDNEQFSRFHEIWKGVTADGGATFTWTPITENSTHDNLRPIVPKWNCDNTALLWFRANYTTAQIVDGAPVGLLERKGESSGKMVYVDATAKNTTLTNGTPLLPGKEVGRWHVQNGIGNGGSVLCSADVVGEDAPMLKTSAQIAESGTYDVWVNFWFSSEKGADWQIMGGLAPDQMQIFRQLSCKTVQPGEHKKKLLLNSDSNFLYQAYLGRVTVKKGESINVFVDDHAIVTGTTGPLVGNDARTWYDGVSYAKVNLAETRAK